MIHEERVGFRATFDSAGLSSTEPQWNQILGHGLEHLVQKPVALPSGRGLQQRLAEATCSSQ